MSAWKRFLALLAAQEPGLTSAEQTRVCEMAVATFEHYAAAFNVAGAASASRAAPSAPGNAA